MHGMQLPSLLHSSAAQGHVPAGNTQEPDCTCGVAIETVELVPHRRRQVSPSLAIQLQPLLGDSFALLDMMRRLEPQVWDTFCGSCTAKHAQLAQADMPSWMPSAAATQT